MRASTSSYEAASRLEAAGHFDEAALAYIQLKRLADAARCRRAEGRLLDAGQLHFDAGQFYEAAWCFLQTGETGRFLDAVARIPRDHEGYRGACIEAVKVAARLGVLDFQLDHFLGRFVATGPESQAEAEAFYQLGRLYEAHDYADNAREVYSRLNAKLPGYRDIVSRIAALENERRSSAMVDAKIRREDEAFLAAGVPHRAATSSFPGLPELPNLPDLPPLPGTHLGHSAPPPPTTGITRRASAPPASPGILEGQPGWCIAGRYRVEGKLGQGGMAAVYRALDLELGEPVAIKLFLQPSEDPELLQRFRQELAVCRQIAHPNVVRLFDIGTHEARKFISMELLSGSDLAGLIDGPMELRKAVHYLVQACAGLEAAHERGIIHRDVKPENFFVSEGDVLKVMDFGIAKRSESPGLTRAGFIAGTPEYMAPEQIQDFGTVTHLADLYALGIVAYQLFTGTVPFRSDELVPLLMMQVNEAPQPLRMHNPDLPEELDDLTLRLLAKNPADRIQSCRELSRELRRIMR